MASTRLPGKPLLDLGGKAIIDWVIDAVVDSSLFDTVALTSPDRAVLAHARQSNDDWDPKMPILDLYTTARCRNGLERCAEAVLRMEAEYDDHDLCLSGATIVNVQGDQPFVSAEHLRAVVAEHERARSRGETGVVTTLVTPMVQEDYDNPSVVSVWRSDPRTPVWSRTPGRANRWSRHVGIYAYTYESLMQAASADCLEDLEQLQIMRAGVRFAFAESDVCPGIEINTPADLEAARKAVAFMGAV